MFSLFQLMSKNFKLLLRSKAATAALFFGPIILVLLFGVAFNTAQLYGLKLAMYTPESSNITENIASKLSTQFLIIKTASAESCIQGVKVNKWHVCFVFPENFSVETNNKIEFYVDPTHINLVQTIINMISIRVEESTDEIRVSLIEDIMQATQSIEKELAESDKKIISFKSDISEINNNLHAAVEDISQINFDLSLNEFKISEFESVLDKIKTENEKIEDEAASINNSGIRETIEVSCSAIKKHLTNCTSKLSQIQDTAELAVSKLNQASQSVENVKQEIDSVIKKLDELIVQLDSLSKSIKTMEGYAKQIRSLSAGQVAQPITTNINQIIPEKNYLELILPLLIALLLLFGGIFLGSSLIISEKKSKAYFRNFILPINKGMFVLSTYLTAIVIIMLQVLVLFAVLFFIIKLPLTWPLFLVIFLAGSIFILVGMAIGYISRTSETSLLLTLVVILFVLFFSNLILPIETIAYLKGLALYNPLTIATSTIKSINLLGLGFEFHIRNFILLASYLAALFGLALGFQQWSKRHI